MNETESPPVNLTVESRLIALLNGLEQLSSGLTRPAAQVTAAARDVLRQLKTVDLGRALNTDLQYRVEQWEGEELQRVVAACAILDIAIEGWKVAVQRDPKSAWLVRQGAQVLKTHRPI